MIFTGFFRADLVRVCCGMSAESVRKFLRKPCYNRDKDKYVQNQGARKWASFLCVETDLTQVIAMVTYCHVCGHMVRPGVRNMHCSICQGSVVTMAKPSQALTQEQLEIAKCRRKYSRAVKSGNKRLQARYRAALEKLGATVDA